MRSSFSRDYKMIHSGIVSYVTIKLLCVCARTYTGGTVYCIIQQQKKLSMHSKCSFKHHF